MNFNNPPAESPQNVFHKTFYSQLINHEIGYNIYLPPDYDTAEKRYPVTYHLHGWQVSRGQKPAFVLFFIVRLFHQFLYFTKYSDTYCINCKILDGIQLFSLTERFRCDRIKITFRLFIAGRDSFC